ncbi:MAG: hypothetical protein LBT86_05715 [Deltaproteobacteria bacterium]|nr:hypothetical protein [Deltaproteobacteria bacterium]
MNATRDEFSDYLAQKLNHVENYLRKGAPQFKDPLMDEFERTPLHFSDSFIWNRHYSFRFPYWGDVVIHGHSATIGYNEYKGSSYLPKGYESQFEKYHIESRLPFFFSRGQGAGYVWPEKVDQNDFASFLKIPDHIFDCGLKGAVEAINIDTGAAYKGGALTALGLSAKTLAKNEFLTLTTLITKSDAPQRDSFPSLMATVPTTPSVLKRTIKTGRLGADMNDQEFNALFPYDCPEGGSTAANIEEQGDFGKFFF